VTGDGIDVERSIGVDEGLKPGDVRDLTAEKGRKRESEQAI
jgi:hypothetical protein